MKTNAHHVSRSRKPDTQRRALHRGPAAGLRVVVAATARGPIELLLRSLDRVDRFLLSLVECLLRRLLALEDARHRVHPRGLELRTRRRRRDAERVRHDARERLDVLAEP